MKQSTRAIRAAIATGALGTALFAGIAPAAAGGKGDPCEIKVGTGAGRALDPCYTPVTRPEDTTTTTTEAVVTTTTEGEATTTSQVTVTTMGTVPTTAGPTTTAPTVGGATGARPVAAQASYTG